MSDTLSGSCLCGAVRFSVGNDFKHFYFCHCSQCQKITGSAHAANLLSSVDNIVWTGGQAHIKRYDHPEREFSKVFCNICGCGLPFVNKSGTALIVPAGCLDTQPDIKPNNQLFWAERASWYDAAASAKHCAGFAE